MPSPATLVAWIMRGLDIPAANAQALAEKTVPALIVGDVSQWWENDSRVVRPAAGWYVRAAVAANFSHVGLVNPATSGINCIVRRTYQYQVVGDPTSFEYVMTTEAVFKALTGAAQGTTLVGFRDPRGFAPSPASAANRPVAEVWAGYDTGLVDGHRFRKVTIEMNKSPEWQWPADILIPPGGCLACGCLTLNTAIDYVAWDWDEHRIPR